MPTQRIGAPANGGLWTPGRIKKFAQALESVDRACDRRLRVSADPVGIVRTGACCEERELLGLLASCLAFGNVKAIRTAIGDVQHRLGGPLPSRLDVRHEVARALDGFCYRMVRGQELGQLLLAARQMQRDHGSLGARFVQFLSATGSLREGLALWAAELRETAQLAKVDPARRGPGHLLPDPRQGSSCKRLLLFLRWMVRRDDGVDLGCWADVSPSILVMPVDVHVWKMAKCLGMTERSAPSWAVAEEITSILARLDPADPVRFDFSLCHLAMSGQCKGRWIPGVCGTCGLLSLCRYGKR